MLADAIFAEGLPFHGGNRGSNPLGDAIYFRYLVVTRLVTYPINVQYTWIDPRKAEVVPRSRAGPFAQQRQLHRRARRKFRVAATPRALRPAWSAPHRSSKRRVSVVAASGGVSMSRLLVGMITKIV